MVGGDYRIGDLGSRSCPGRCGGRRRHCGVATGQQLAAGHIRQAGCHATADCRAGRRGPSWQPSSTKPATRVTGGSGTLPNDAGQVWREYDISPYTTRVTTTKRPEQAIIDWILRETGYEAWHTEPLGILSAGPRTLRVYHTPKMQEIVADLVDRFVSSEAATLHVLAAGCDARQSQLAHGGPAVAAPGAGADAQRQRLAAGQGGRGHPVGPNCAAAATTANTARPI